jgi:hypothetical protein
MATYPNSHYTDPATYITQIDGKFYVVHYGEAVSSGMTTITDALDSAAKLDLKVSPVLWEAEHHRNVQPRANHR